MRTHGVVVPPPFLERDACLGERGEQHLVQELVVQAAIEALDEGVLHGPARGGECQSTPVWPVQARMALLVSSVPLSLPMALGLAWAAISRSSSRATLLPDSEKSAIAARQRRVHTS